MIGVFDSGLGGLTVLSALRARLPREDFVYFADTANLPYGEKAESFIQMRSIAIAWHLQYTFAAKAIVIACNTATAMAAEAVRRAVDCPVIALEPAVKPAAALSKTGVIGVLATTRTLGSLRFQKLVEAHAHRAQVIAQPCPGLAEAIERADEATVDCLIDEYVRPLIHYRADIVVLGCTHYPWIKEKIAARLPGVKLIDTGEAIARQTERRLKGEDLLEEDDRTGGLRIGTSGDPQEAAAAIFRLTGKVLNVENWPIQ
ncbi:MAG: glutamate racemase [Zoogloeaceae bacterium]|jgi:glutamate racemase|nr:glutamate racemase [Zoogloeaceae bacterium]